MVDERSILITGASSGIGAATALMAAENGYNVGIGYHSDQNGAEEVAAACMNLGAKCILLKGNVASSEDVNNIFNSFHSTFGQPNAVVNNAGIVAHQAKFEDMSQERMRRVFDINILGAFFVAQEAVRRMAYRNNGKGGVIINLSSVAALGGSGGTYVDYAATKGAIDTMTKGLGNEMASEGVRVVGVRPGIIDTPIHTKGGMKDRVDSILPQLPMQRAGSAQEVAAAILWAASDDASYVTRTTIDVTGGY